MSPRLRLHEHQVASRVLAALNSWLTAVTGPVMAPFRRHSDFPDPTAVYGKMGLWNDQVRELLPELETAARIGWSEAFNRPTFSSSSSHVRAALLASERFMSDLPSEVYDMVAREISDGLSTGRSREQIAQSVSGLLTMTGNDTFTNRARMITGTEVTRAANAGALAAALQAESELGPIMKQWNDSADDRVRVSHELADDTEIPVSQPFVVGGFPMMYPGDPMGPPWEVIQCRCDLSFRRVNG